MCGACGTTLLIQTTLSHTPTNNDGDIILLVATHPPQSFVGPRIHHNFIMWPQTQLVNYCTTLAIKIIFCITKLHTERTHKY